MKSHRPSRTAEHNALFRAIETNRPAGTRLLHDPLARFCLGHLFGVAEGLSRWAPTATMLCRYIDLRWPGSRTSVVARTCLIDDYVGEALASGIRQVVILGAGFDTRAYRIHGANSARFFEVDHQNTSASKRKRLATALGQLPGHVTYVSADLQREALPDVLREAGFDRRKRSLLLWEGVSNYLTEQAVRATFQFIATLASNSRVIFTYVDEDVVAEPSKFVGGREVQKTLTRLSEPWTFGIQPEKAAKLFAECGLRMDSDLSAVEYRFRYYGALARKIEGYEFYHVVTAHVPSDAQRCRASNFLEAHSA